MKKIFTSAAIAFIAIALHAETYTKKHNINISGFAIIDCQSTKQRIKDENSFSLRMARIVFDGHLFNYWYWKTQLNVTGINNTLASSPKLVDLFLEWQRYDFLRIKVGQFKIPFTFENPMNPIDQGFMSYSQAVTKLAGFSDRSGQHSSNGRDIGVQVQGDFLKTTSGRPIFHYQIGMFNGQGINVKDVDTRKNLIAGLTLMPIKGLRLGIFGWLGTYSREGNWIIDNNIKKTGIRSLEQRRYAISIEYVKNDWTVRSEFIHSIGNAFRKPLVNINDVSSHDCNLSDDGNKAQGGYALIIAPILKKKLYAKARYDLYIPSEDCRSRKTLYEIGVNYRINNNIQIAGEYAYYQDYSVLEKNKTLIDVQLSYKF